MSYTGEIKVSRSSALHSLGAAGVLVDAVVVGSAVAAAMAAAAAVKLATAPVSIITGVVRNAQAKKIKGEFDSMAENAEKLSAEFDEKMRKASDECYKSYEETLGRLKETYDKEHDYTAFMNSCKQAREKLYRELSEKGGAIESKYAGELDGMISKSRNAMNIERREVEDSIQRIEDRQEKRKKAVGITEAILAETESLLDQLSADSEGIGYCGELIAKVREMCDKVRLYLSNGMMYEAALANAYSARNAALFTIADIMKKEAANKRRYADVSAGLAAAEKLLNDNRRGKLVFDRTRDGEPVTAETDDLSIYYRGSFEKLESSLNGIKARFGRFSDYRDFNFAELEDTLSEIERWQDSFLKETRTAYERLENMMLRGETADLLAEKFASDGFEILPPTWEDQNISSLDSIIIRMEHGITGEKMCLRLNSETGADGHIGMTIQIEDHTKYKGSDSEVETARENERKSVCAAISDSNIGKGMQIGQRCTNPGVRDDG